MDHPIIVKAFANAKERQCKNKEVKIYISFKRTGNFYLDTYCILIGTWAEVNVAIQNTFKIVDQDEKEYALQHDYYKEILDTPFDTWGCSECKFLHCDDKIQLDNKLNSVNYDSLWSCTEHNSQEDLDLYLSNIQQGYYNNYSIEYI
jgi:hypothetical protein